MTKRILGTLTTVLVALVCLGAAADKFTVNRTSGGAWSIKVNISGTPTTILSSDGTGAITIGATTTAMFSTPSITTNGHLMAGGTVGTTPGDKQLIIGTNIDIAAAGRDGRVSGTNTTGAAILFQNTNSDTNASINFYTNLTTDNNTSHAANVIGTATSQGSWVFGPTGTLPATSFAGIYLVGQTNLSSSATSGGTVGEVGEWYCDALSAVATASTGSGGAGGIGDLASRTLGAGVWLVTASGGVQEQTLPGSGACTAGGQIVDSTNALTLAIASRSIKFANPFVNGDSYFGSFAMTAIHASTASWVLKTQIRVDEVSGTCGSATVNSGGSASSYQCAYRIH